MPFNASPGDPPEASFLRVSLLLAVAALLLAGPALAAGVCAPTCDVLTLQMAFAPAVTVVESGASVRWSTMPADIPHTATANDGSSCFHAAFTPSRPATASFRIAGGALLAKAGLTEKACTGATALPDGAFRLPYFCLYHQQMLAELVVVPEVNP